MKKIDPRVALAANLKHLHQDHSKVRNVAILMAYMEQEHINLHPFLNKIKDGISSVKEE